MKHIRWVAALAGLLLGHAALAQQVFQSPPIIPNHPAAWQTSGTIFDPGPASGSLPGGGINEQLFVVPPKSDGSAQPWSNTGTGPSGANVCDWDGFNNGPRHYVCLTPNDVNGKTALVFGALGGATPLTFEFIANGVVYPFPFVVGGIVGPGSTTVGHLATWNNTNGTLLADGGVAPTGTVTSVALALPNIFTVSGSPITGAGTLTATLANQTQNLVWASPNGSTGPPLFRALVAADLPAGAIFPTTPQGRLTLASATPVMTATVSGATSIYYTTYVGNQVPTWNGTVWTNLGCPELTNITTNSSTGNAGPAAVAASSNYDLFVWSNSGTCTLTRGPAWTTNTARANTLIAINGVLVNNASITNGPTSNQGTFVGTVHSNGSSTIDYIFGASGNPPTAASFQVWNDYNRVLTTTQVNDTHSAYTYTSSTIRQVDGTTGNQVSFVEGLQEDAISASFQNYVILAGTSTTAAWGLGLDTTTAFTCGPAKINQGSATTNISMPSNCPLSVGIGNHTISANEQSDNTNAQTFNTGGAALLAVTIRN